MKIGIISGSHRSQSESERIANVVDQTLRERGLCDETWLFSLAGNPLPLWDESVFEKNSAWSKRLQPLREQLDSSDAFVVISPEWHGMATPALKNFFLIMTGGEQLAHKPALLIAVSASEGGAYPIAELRMSSYKNNRICYLPEHLIVRRSGSVFHADAQQNDARAHEYLSGRLNYCLELLREYALAFVQIRASGKGSLGEYRNGM